MAYGLQTFDASGNVRIDLSDNIPRVKYDITLAQDTSGTYDIGETIDWTNHGMIIQSISQSYPHIIETSGSSTSSFTYSLKTDAYGGSFRGPTRVIIFQYQ